MANPQKENGYVPIANEIVDAFCKLKLSPNEWQVLWCIIRYSYGWNKKAARLTYSRIAELTGIASPNIARALKKLKQKKIISGNAKSLSLQKDYEKWNYYLNRQYLNRQYFAIRTDSKILSKQIVATPLKPLPDKSLQSPKDIHKDNINTSLSEREKLEKKVKEIFPQWVSIPKSIPTEKLFLLVHKINKGEIKAENIKSPIAYLVGMIEEDIEPLITSERTNRERLRMEEIMKKRIREEQEKEKERNKKEISFKIKEFVAQLNA